MAGSERTHIDLTDELEQEVYTTYENLTEALKEVLGTTKASLVELCNKTQYQPMVNMVNTMVDSFQQEVTPKARTIFQEWQTGDASFTAAARNSEAGSEAEAVAGDSERNIEEFFESFWIKNPFAEEIIGIKCIRPVIRDEDFDTLEEIYQKATESLEGEEEQAIGEIKRKGDDNPTYLLAIPPMEALAETLKKAFEGFTGRVKDYRAESQERTETQKARSEDMAERALNTAASAAEVADSMKFFADI